MTITSRRPLLRRAGVAALALAAAVAVSTPSLAASATAAKGKGCADAGEAAAMHVRSLQTWLVVASLSCGTVEDYNTFVVKYKGSLQRHGDQLIRYFNRAYGKGGNDKLNRYVTLLANEASRLSLDDREAFCARAAAIYDEMEGDAVSANQLDSYSAEKVGLLAVEPKSCMPEGLLASAR
ncbi:hypothetical protein [Caenispirillum bisanense]|uniref:hypothetical protein n=1 Tax=Caenispirillum bisanense TaxID=414052 RepID=UPI0031DCF714